MLKLMKSQTIYNSYRDRPNETHTHTNQLKLKYKLNISGISCISTANIRSTAKYLCENLWASSLEKQFIQNCVIWQTHTLCSLTRFVCLLCFYCLITIFVPFICTPPGTQSCSFSNRYISQGRVQLLPVILNSHFSLHICKYFIGASFTSLTACLSVCMGIFFGVLLSFNRIRFRAYVYIFFFVILPSFSLVGSVAMRILVKLLIRLMCRQRCQCRSWWNESSRCNGKISVCYHFYSSHSRHKRNRQQ